MAPPTLILSDVHERIPEVERLLRYYLPRVREVIVLGDYFDSFTRSEATTQRTCSWLTEALQDRRMRMLLGNHDLQYIWPAAPWVRCSGFYPGTLATVQQMRPEALRALADPRGRVAVMAHGWLLSHAGLHPRHVPLTGWSEPWFLQEVDRARIRLLGRHPTSTWLWASGRDRGGLAQTGGPLWLGWESFVDAPKVLPPQIVGHTQGQQPRQTGRSWCLDTALRYVGLLAADGTLTVESVPGSGGSTV